MNEWAIWSNEHRAFWGEAGVGYVRSLAEAKRFTAEQAQAICNEASAGGVLFQENEAGHKIPPEMMILAPRRQPRVAAEHVAALAVAEYGDGHDFPGAERLLEIIAHAIRTDRENFR